MKKNNRSPAGAVIIMMALIMMIFSGTALSQELLDMVRQNDTLAVQKLIAEGADVNVQDDMMGYTPLNLAVNQKNATMVKILLRGGANINHRDKIYGYTPLMSALSTNCEDIARMLIEEGADIRLKSNNGATALILAAMHSREMVELLLAKGADIHARSDNGSGVFTNCVMGIISGRVGPDLAEYLLSKGADIDEMNTTSYYQGYTPLFWAVEDNNVKLVKLLILHGAKVNAKAGNGKTPLSLATEKGFEEITKLLKEAGAA